jgi:hypothetical protein
MKANSRQLIYPGIFIFGLFILQPTMAQSLERQVVSSSGATFNEGAYTLDFTFGEMMTTTFEQGNELCQGFQQAWAVLTAIGSIPTEMDIKLYPNPTIDILNIEVSAKTDLQILDLNGRVVMSLHLAAGNETIDVAELPAGTYFIRCMDVENRRESTFKLVKLE